MCRQWSHFTMEQCIAVQEELREKITLCLECRPEELQLIAGVDLAYWKQGKEEQGVCCIVVMDRTTKAVVEQASFAGKITYPYIPGCLAFRELPLVMEAAGKLEKKPDLYMFDGNGYLHPRHMGIATHASFYLHGPTIGIAKSYYKIGETDYVMPENREGAYTGIVIDGEVYGRVLRTHRDVKPVFVSVGNGIDLDTATSLALDLVGRESHIPAPTRLADLETHKARDAIKGLLNGKKI